MNTSSIPPAPQAHRWLGTVVLIALCGGLVIGGYFTRDRWLPHLAGLSAKLSQPAPAAASGHDHDHGHDHGSGDAGVQNEIMLSEQARRNLRLKVGTVAPQTFWKTITVPGEVAEVPGRSERRMNATVQGVILKVHVLTGQSVHPGDPLFDVQITSELLAASQSNLLKTIQDLEIVETDLQRLLPAVSSGSLPQKTRIEKESEQRRLKAAREVQIQELRVRGLTQQQIETVIKTRTLMRSFTIYVPKAPRPGEEVPIEESQAERSSTGAGADQKETATRTVSFEQTDLDDTSYLVEKLDVFPGKLVQQGDELCDLALHDVLQIRGEAFESEAELIHRTLAEQWPVTATFELGLDTPVVRKDLRILYANSVIDPNARSFDFFLPLANEVIHDTTGPKGRVFRSWRFKPGQKVQLHLRVEKLEKRIVVPADAVVSEGAEAYVFKVNGKKLERQAVTVDYRDPREVVLANDGSLFPGDEIALNAAYQLNMAIKKASGSGIDPHAGHNH